MFCSNCGSNINEGAKFCEKCGTPVVTDLSTKVVTTEVANREPPKKKNGALVVILVVISALALLVFGGIGLVILFSLNNGGLLDHTVTCELEGKEEGNRGTIKFVLIDGNSRVKRIESTITSEFKSSEVAESMYKYMGKNACSSYDEDYEECESVLRGKKVNTTIVIDYEKKAKKECSDLTDYKEKKECKEDTYECYTSDCKKYSNSEAAKKAEEELDNTIYSDYTIKCK